jgi:hypothetical protein
MGLTRRIVPHLTIPEVPNGDGPRRPDLPVPRPRRSVLTIRRARVGNLYRRLPVGGFRS